MYGIIGSGLRIIRQRMSVVLSMNDAERTLDNDKG